MSDRIIIVGAPRSGTNMLRDALTSIKGISTWPCDEINYIWRHGNVRYPSDEFPADIASLKVSNYIRRRFNEIQKKCNAKVVVEKTCANSLRVPFLDAVFPDARYLFIVRDGIDATGSAKLRWTAELDLTYIMEKVRYVPIMDLPYYSIRYFWSRLHRFFSSEKRLAFWGPALADMQEILQKHTLNEVCAIQWQRCVEKSADSFSNMPSSKVCQVRYEEFVRNPMEELGKILGFIGIDASEKEMKAAVSNVSAKSLGKGRESLGREEVEKLEALVGDTLRKFGYLEDA